MHCAGATLRRKGSAGLDSQRPPDHHCRQRPGERMVSATGTRPQGGTTMTRNACRAGGHSAYAPGARPFRGPQQEP